MQSFARAFSRAIVSKPRSLAAAQPRLIKTRTLRPLTTTPTLNSTMGSQAPATASKADGFLELVKARRSIYALNKSLPISNSRVQTIIEEALQHIPSSFNSQSNRVLLLFGADHDKFWGITTDILKAIVPADNWEATATRMAGFKGGYGTALFFEDQTAVEELQAKFPMYSDRFQPWAGHTSAMLQFAVWTMLEAEGLGANLQHYNPLVDAKVVEEWGVPPTWKLTAQLVFGGRQDVALREKTFEPLEKKLKVFGA